MNTKKLMSQVNDSVNRLSIQNLAIELNELSEEELQQIVGAIQGDGCTPTFPIRVGGSKPPRTFDLTVQDWRVFDRISSLTV